MTVDEDKLIRSQCVVASRMFLAALLGRQKDDKALLHPELFAILNVQAKKLGYVLTIDTTGDSLNVKFTDL